MTNVVCSHCHGTGKESLSPSLAETLALVPRTYTYTKDIFAKHTSGYVKACAINNRLRALQEHGLIDCQVRGRKLFWRRVK